LIVKIKVKTPFASEQAFWGIPCNSQAPSEGTWARASSVSRHLPFLSGLERARLRYVL
jgi:hypothetical protein